MIAYKGRLGIVQYMPKKPMKRGIKVCIMCTSFLGYVYDFEIYCGKKRPNAEKELCPWILCGNISSKTNEITIYISKAFLPPVIL